MNIPISNFQDQRQQVSIVPLMLMDALWLYGRKLMRMPLHGTEDAARRQPVLELNRARIKFGFIGGRFLDTMIEFLPTKLSNFIAYL